jgi:hypothetical protein
MARDEWQSDDPQSRSFRRSRYPESRERGGWSQRVFRSARRSGQERGYGEEWLRGGRPAREMGARGWQERLTGYGQGYYGGRRWEEGRGYGGRALGRQRFGMEREYGEEFPSLRGPQGWRGEALRRGYWRGEGEGIFGRGGGYDEEFAERERHRGYGGAGRERFGWRGRPGRYSRYGGDFGR